MFATATFLLTVDNFLFIYNVEKSFLYPVDL